MTKWCCSPFKSYAGTHGGKGLSIAICQCRDGKIRGVLRFQAIERLADSRLIPNNPLCIALDSTCFISHCPWCGAPLGDRYSESDASMCS